MDNFVNIFEYNNNNNINNNYINSGEEDNDREERVLRRDNNLQYPKKRSSSKDMALNSSDDDGGVPKKLRDTPTSMIRNSRQTHHLYNDPEVASFQRKGGSFQFPTVSSSQTPERINMENQQQFSLERNLSLPSGLLVGSGMTPALRNASFYENAQKQALQPNDLQSNVYSNTASFYENTQKQALQPTNLQSNVHSNIPRNLPQKALQPLQEKLNVPQGKLEFSKLVFNSRNTELDYASGSPMTGGKAPLQKDNVGDEDEDNTKDQTYKNPSKKYRDKKKVELQEHKEKLAHLEAENRILINVIQELLQKKNTINPN